jgi:hypothetical protein
MFQHILLSLCALANQLYAILNVKLLVKHGLWVQVAYLFYMLLALHLHLDYELNVGPWFGGGLFSYFFTCLPLMVWVEIHFRFTSHTKLFQSLYHTM